MSFMPELPAAPLPRRVLAYLIDVSVCVAPFMLIALIAAGAQMRGALLDMLMFKRVDEKAFGLDAETIAAGNFPWRVGGVLLVLIAGAGCWTAYRVVLTGRYGTSIGKRVMSLRVVDVESGAVIGVKRAWKRWAPNQVLGLLPVPGSGMVSYVAALTDKRRRGLHDRAAASMVICTSQAAAGSAAR